MSRYRQQILPILTILLSVCTSYGQFEKQNINTDSSDIEIIRNSVYHIHEETFKNKDSVWYSVHFIEDTTRLNTEGWQRKDKTRMGVWQEYNFDGQLLFTWDYDRNICKVNKSLYPYHDLMEQMKSKADSIIMATYSPEFYDNHVRFEYDCYAYHRYRDTFDDEIFWAQNYLGSWTEPMKAKPNSFLFRYQVRLHKSDKKSIELGIELDSLGNYLPSADDTWNSYGFEAPPGNKKTFTISAEKAIQVASKQGLVLTDSSIVSEFLIWENAKKQEFYNGQFRYYITNMKNKTEYQTPRGRQGVIYRYDVYVFNPWNGAFVEKKKMKSIREWGKYSGHSSGLLPDDD